MQVVNKIGRESHLEKTNFFVRRQHQKKKIKYKPKPMVKKERQKHSSTLKLMSAVTKRVGTEERREREIHE